MKHGFNKVYKYVVCQGCVFRGKFPIKKLPVINFCYKSSKFLTFSDYKSKTHLVKEIWKKQESMVLEGEICNKIIY